MLRIEFPPADLERIGHERYYHPHRRVRRKLEALWLKSQGLPHEQIAVLTEVTTNTLRRYLREYQQEGLESVLEPHFRQPVSALAGHELEMKLYFPAHPVASAAEAAAKVEQLTGVKRSANGVGQYLQRLGFGPRKVGALPAKADAQVQEAFQKNS